MFYNSEKADFLRDGLLKEMSDVKFSCLYEIQSEEEFIFFMIHLNEFLNEEKQIDAVFPN